MSEELVAAADINADIKADGARISPADVLAKLQQQPEWADVSLSQVRRAISLAPKLDAVTKARRRADKERERDAKRVRSGRARPAEQQAGQQAQQPKATTSAGAAFIIGTASRKDASDDARIGLIRRMPPRRRRSTIASWLSSEPMKPKDTADSSCASGVGSSLPSGGDSLSTTVLGCSSFFFVVTGIQVCPQLVQRRMRAPSPCRLLGRHTTEPHFVRPSLPHRGSMLCRWRRLRPSGSSG